MQAALDDAALVFGTPLNPASIAAEVFNTELPILLRGYSVLLVQAGNSPEAVRQLIRAVREEKANGKASADTWEAMGFAYFDS